MAPTEIPKLPGFESLKVTKGVVEVIPRETFSGVMNVPVTITENGASVTIQIPVVINPKPISEGVTKPAAKDKTVVEWEPSPNAVSYKVELNGKVLCSTSGSACNVPKLLGPKSKLEIISLGNDGTVSTETIPAYVPGKLIPVLDVNFKLGSAAIDSKQREKLDEFVALMKQEGFTKVSIKAFTDGVGGSQGAKVLSAKRAQEVANYLKQFLDVSLNSKGNGLAPTAKGSNKSDRSARKAQISVK